MDSYPATTANLHERLSEMYHFDRRGYIVDSSLSEAVYPLLDFCHVSKAEEGSPITLIRNDNGVLNGYHFVIANASVDHLYRFFTTGEW